MTIKQNGSEKAFFTKEIGLSDDKSIINFIYDGNQAIKNIKIPSLEDPQSMSITATFLPFIDENYIFSGGEVDLVFYYKDLNTEEVFKLNPALRITIPTDKKFTTFILPPLPEGGYFAYTFDIFKKGTDEVVFQSKDNYYKVNPHLGSQRPLLFMNEDYEYKSYFPGKKYVVAISPNTEFGGINWDEIFITGILVDLKNYLNVE